MFDKEAADKLLESKVLKDLQIKNGNIRIEGIE
jgi:hypothetical protein